MAEQYWTGPADRPRRYVVAADGGVLRHEPGGGVEGMVYRATVDDPGTPEHGDTVALKLLLTVSPTELTDVGARLGGLLDIDDPGLMRVRSTFVGTALTDDPTPLPEDFDVCYVVSDWIEGHGLADVVADRGPAFALAAVADVGRAVDRLHRVTSPDAPRGIVHRDLKSSNVRVADDGRVIVIDYGLARPDAHDASVVGTPGWLAPEVAAGAPGGKPADAYGVGAIAHDLLVGAPPRRDGEGAARDRLASALADTDVALPDDVACHIAALLATDPARRPVDLAVWADQLDGLLDGRRVPRPRSLRRPATALAVALVLAVAIGGVVWAATSGDGAARASTVPTTLVPGPTAPTTTTWRCVSEPTLGDGVADTTLRTALAALDGACVGPSETLADAVIVPLLTDDGRPDGVLIASPTTPAVRLTDAQYASYREIAGRSQPENAVLYGGYPIAVTHPDGTDLSVIDLSTGGMVVGRRTDTQSFWLPQQARGLWEAYGGFTGRLGIPTSNVFFSGDRLKLEFEHGSMEAVVRGSSTAGSTWLPIDASTTDVVIVDDPDAELAKFGDVTGRVVRQAGGTAWFVDDQRVRHWIADGATWNCLHADDHLVEGDVPGYAVAALELGPPATCPRQK